MRSELALRLVVPVSFTYLRISLWVKRVVDPAARSRCLADDQQSYITCSIIEEGMGNTGARRKANTVARLQSLEIAIKPKVGRTFKYINKLFFICLRMGPGYPPSRQQAFMMDAEPH